MSKLYNIIKNNYGIHVGFTIDDLHETTNIDKNKLYHILNKMSDNLILTKDNRNNYFLHDIETINENIEHYNNTIDEYKLYIKKLKKFKI